MQINSAVTASTEAVTGTSAQQDAADPAASPFSQSLDQALASDSTADTGADTLAAQPSAPVAQTRAPARLPAQAANDAQPDSDDAVPSTAASALPALQDGDAAAEPVAQSPVAQAAQQVQAASLDETLSPDAGLASRLAPVASQAASHDAGQDSDVQAGDDDDSALQDIRQRMELIQSAGQLDGAALAMLAPAVAPVAAQGMSPSGVTQGASSDGVSLDADWSGQGFDPSALADAPVDAQADEVPGQVLLPVADSAQSIGDDVLQAASRQEAATPDDSWSDSLAGSDAPDSTVTPLASLPGSSLLAVGSSGGTTAGTGAALASVIGSGQWQADLGQQVIDMLRRGDQQVDLRLHPADLGPLSISLTISDGTTQAQFQSAHAAVRSAVEQALPQLREALASQGISLGQASVNDQSSRQASGGQAQREERGEGGRTQASAVAVQEAQVVQALPVRLSGVDLYV